jgi:hypothetical protein
MNHGVHGTLLIFLFLFIKVAIMEVGSVTLFIFPDGEIFPK